MSTEAQITAWIASQQQAMIDLLRETVDIDSGSYNKAGIDAVGNVRSNRAVAALARVAARSARVLREGRVVEVAAADLVLLAMGENVPLSLIRFEFVARKWLHQGPDQAQNGRDSARFPDSGNHGPQPFASDRDPDRFHSWQVPARGPPCSKRRVRAAPSGACVRSQCGAAPSREPRRRTLA